MPFIPNHDDNCKRKHCFPTNCPWCRQSVTYIECTCPHPSKVYLPLGEEDIRHGEHECGEVRKFARSLVMPLWENGTAVSVILQEIDHWNSPTENEQIIVERCKRFMREKVGALWGKKLHDDDQGKSSRAVLRRFMSEQIRNSGFSDEVKCAAKKVRDSLVPFEISDIDTTPTHVIQPPADKSVEEEEDSNHPGQRSLFD